MWEEETSTSLSYIIRRFGFQTKILKEIHNNYSELQEYYILELSISTAADTDTTAIIFYFLLRKSREISWCFAKYLRMRLQSRATDAILKT